jgi:pyruvate dehydrogenase kinase 2/3/4
LTETYEKHADTPKNNYVGEIFLRCDAKAVVERCAAITGEIMRSNFGNESKIPKLEIQGHLHATFPYILSHLEYIIGEILRNSMQATIEHHKDKDQDVPPIEVLICETDQHVIMRFSDRGGGAPRDVLPHIWSFSKGPKREIRLKNLKEVPRMSATLQELQPQKELKNNSLASLSTRRPALRLGVGLPMSKIYAEYWAGSLQMHNLEGYGLDAFLQISKLGNKNEEISTRATIDAV